MGTDYANGMSAPFSRIVVGAGLSAASDRAIHLALSLARCDHRVELVFCHVIDIPRMLARADRYADDCEVALRAARDDAQRLLDRCRALAAEFDVEGRTCIRYGKPAAEIVALAQAFAADLIVIGNHPRARLHRFLCGSVSNEVMRMPGMPVLVANPDESPIGA